MKVKVPYTWKQARACKFNQDAVRREAVPYRAKKRSCFITKQNESGVGDIKEWLAENEITEYAMFGVFVEHPDRVYFSGLAFEFKNEDHALYFKLRFF